MVAMRRITTLDFWDHCPAWQFCSYTRLSYLSNSYMNQYHGAIFRALGS